jgi:hypothetical protein
MPPTQALQTCGLQTTQYVLVQGAVSWQRTQVTTLVN